MVLEVVCVLMISFVFGSNIDIIGLDYLSLYLLSIMFEQLFLAVMAGVCLVMNRFSKVTVYMSYHGYAMDMDNVLKPLEDEGHGKTKKADPKKIEPIKATS